MDLQGDSLIGRASRAAVAALTDRVVALEAVAHKPVPVVTIDDMTRALHAIAHHRFTPTLVRCFARDLAQRLGLPGAVHWGPR